MRDSPPSWRSTNRGTRRDDSRRVRRGQLHRPRGDPRAFEDEEDIEVVATCRDFDSLRMTVDDVLPDVVIADISMPPTNTDEGIRLAEELRTTHPDIGVVILSQYAEPVFATQLLEAGSDGRAYLLKDRVQYRSDLTHAVREVASGRSVIDSRIVELLLAARRQRADSHFDALTPREQEILALIAEGSSNAAIAEELVITKRAVERHINSIFMKLDLGDSETTSRRVKAALLYLAGRSGNTAHVHMRATWRARPGRPILRRGYAKQRAIGPGRCRSRGRAHG